MPTEYVVRQGDCISSIAAENGFLPDTLWNHPANAELKRKRDNPNILFEGDIVVIPDKDLKQESRPTNQRHQFRRKGVPEKLHLILLDDCGVPRKNVPYILTIGGTVHTGSTDADGAIKVPIPPNVRDGHLTLRDGGVEEDYPLQLGHLNPLKEISGVQMRLTNLGFDCSSEEGTLGPQTIDAIRRFQEQRGLEVTGELNDTMLQKLKLAHGS